MWPHWIKDSDSETEKPYWFMLLFTLPLYLMIFELIDIIRWNSSKPPLSNKIQGSTPTLSSQSNTTTVTQKNDVIFSLKKPKVPFVTFTEPNTI